MHEGVLGDDVMPEDNVEIMVSLARHEEQIRQNKEDIAGCEKASGDMEKRVRAIESQNERRDARIDQLRWFALLIAGSIAALAFYILRQGVTP